MTLPDRGSSEPRQWTNEWNDITPLDGTYQHEYADRDDDHDTEHKLAGTGADRYFFEQAVSLS